MACSISTHKVVFLRPGSSCVCLMEVVHTVSNVQNKEDLQFDKKEMQS